MFDKMKQLMEMKKQADAIKRELEGASVDFAEINGIKITINGAQHIQSIELDVGLLKGENQDKLEGDLLQSVNGAIKKSQILAAQKMKNVMPDLPGF